MADQRGMLMMVVGPSGCGKDSLIRAVRDELADDPRFVFPTRVITRAEHPSSEEHIHAAVDAFQMAEEGNAFLLHWHAHGHAYGVPGHLEQDLNEGRNVVVNVSRSIIEDAMKTIRPAAVISIKVPRDVAFKRLNDRGRESEEEIGQRLKRFDLHIPESVHAHELDNDQPVEKSIQEFKDLLLKICVAD